MVPIDHLIQLDESRINHWNYWTGWLRTLPNVEGLESVQASIVSGPLGKAIIFLCSFPRLTIASVALALILAIGYLDLITGWELTAFLFYAFPLMLVALRGDAVIGFFFAFLCAGIWLAANTSVSPFTTSWGFPWAVFTRCAFFVLTVVGALSIHGHHFTMLERLEALNRSQQLEQQLSIAAEQIVTAVENEQQRIGRDLHDGISQHLAGIRYAAATLADRLEKRSAPEAHAGHELEGLVVKATEQVRELVKGINPVQLGESGLRAALEELVLHANRTLGARVELLVIGKPRLNDPQRALHLFRIAQEALSNAIKHGCNGPIVLTVEAEARKLSLKVVDSGPGLGSVESGSKGLGLNIMRYRAKLINANLEVSGSPSGTTVSCVLVF